MKNWHHCLHENTIKSDSAVSNVAKKIPLAIKVHLGIKSDGVPKSGFSAIREP